MWTPAILIALTYSHVVSGGSHETRKNVKINVVSLSDCVLPDEAYDKPEVVSHYMSAYKVDRRNTLIRANFTIQRKIGPITTTIRNYEILSNSRQNRVADLNSLQCSDLLVSSIAKMLKIRMTSDCYALPVDVSDWLVQSIRASACVRYGPRWTARASPKRQPMRQHITTVGHYEFEDFDIEQLAGFMNFVWRVGRYAYDIEFRTPRGVVGCVRVVCDYPKWGPSRAAKKP